MIFLFYYSSNNKMFLQRNILAKTRQPDVKLARQISEILEINTDPTIRGFVAHSSLQIIVAAALSFIIVTMIMMINAPISVALIWGGAFGGCIGSILIKGDEIYHLGDV